MFFMDTYTNYYVCTVYTGCFTTHHNEGSRFKIVIFQNGTYGCSSLCPQEHISPSECQHPRLVDVAGQCCREWMCDSRTGNNLTSLFTPNTPRPADVIILVWITFSRATSILPTVVLQMVELFQRLRLRIVQQKIQPKR